MTSFAKAPPSSSVDGRSIKVAAMSSPGTTIHTSPSDPAVRIAVYSIALNEEQFVERWADSAAGADLILLADTGSTDRTRELARACGVQVTSVTVAPFRFDDARNAALAAIPAYYDYCIPLDLDEVLLPGWRDALEVAHAAGLTRPLYRYVWSWTDAARTQPGITFHGDKIHARRGYRWKHPVHEVVTLFAGEETRGPCGVEIHHLPDDTKSRAQYLPLLEMATREDPHDDRNAYYYARELMHKGRNEEAATEFLRHLHLPAATWAPERAASYRGLARCQPERRIQWLTMAAQAAPDRREAWVELVCEYYATRDWAACLAVAKNALAITDPPMDYLNEPWAWNETPWDIGCVAAFQMGETDLARAWCAKAAELAPDNERIQVNLRALLPPSR